MPARMILNPYANRWNAGRRRSEAETALRAAGIELETVVTERPGHGIELAEQAAREGISLIIAAGGDGSINEVVNGIVRACLNGESPWPVLGLMPIGSANDLVANLKLPADPVGAAQAIARGNVRKLDLASVRYAVEPGGEFSPLHYFDNNSAIGLEPTITIIQRDISWIQGVARYLLATFLGILRNPQWNMDLAWDSGEYHGPVTLVSAGNNARTGGMFFMAPHADPFDGKLTFVYGSMRTRRQILALLPRTMKSGEGSFVEHPAISEVHTSWLRIRTDHATPLHTDGEVQAENVREVEYRSLPQVLPVIVP